VRLNGVQEVVGSNPAGPISLGRGVRLISVESVDRYFGDETDYWCLLWPRTVNGRLVYEIRLVRKGVQL
jgi:hypothetical protein